MAQFEVLLKMTITSGGFRIQPANNQGLPEISLEHGQSWPEALDSFLSRIIGQVPYRASLEHAETVPGPKPVLSINLRVSLSEKVPLRDSGYSWVFLSESGSGQPCADQLDPESEVEIYTDGGSRGNPGPAGIGIVLRQKENGYEEEFSRYIGRTTSNVAEYMALVEGLKLALDRGARSVLHFSDSELLVRQLEGSYQVRSPELKTLYDEAGKIISVLDLFQTRHVPRELNSRADMLASQALKNSLGEPDSR